MSSYVVEKKRSKEAEFFVNLFEWCNLACPFCWQDHDKWDGVETIIDRAFDILKVVERDPRKHFIINLMGGELFADEVPDTVFDDYLTLVQEIQKGWKWPDKTFHINWVTNLIFENTHRVHMLMNWLDINGVKPSITTSFDFAGRFSSVTKPLFEKNVYEFREQLGTVSVVLTKPNIEKFMRVRDPLFEKMYLDGFYFYFDYYSPEKNHAVMAPSDKTLQDGLIYLAQNYPETWPIKGWIRDDVNEMTCRGSMIVDHTGYKGQCRSLLTGDMVKKLESKLDLNNNSSMEDTFVTKYNCIQCEFYQKCGMGCFLQHDFKGKEEMDECLYKGVFRRIADVK